jgi:hypothetical protein
VRALKAQHVSAEIERHDSVGYMVLVAYENLDDAERVLRHFRGKLDWKAASG